MPEPDPPNRRRSASAAKVDAAPIIDPEVFLEATAGKRSDLTISSGEIVYSQGEAAHAVYFIKAGRIQLSVVSDQGKEGIIALQGPGDFFGEGCLAGQPVRLATASAAAPSEIARIEKKEMMHLLQAKPELGEQFMAFLLARTMQVEADLVDQLFNSSEKRLARLLLVLANFSNEADLKPIYPKINQDVLAARIGTTRSRVNHFLNKFRRLGLIEYNGAMKVHTSLINVVLNDD